jgi:hypothetical protein
MNIKYIFELEKLILNRISWKINQSTPAEMKAILLDGEQLTTEHLEMIDDWINFSLYEYDLYSKYDQLFISVAGILIVFKYNKINPEKIEAAVLELGLDYDEIKSCMKEIFERMLGEDQEKESEEETNQEYEEIFSSRETTVSSSLSPCHLHTPESVVNEFSLNEGLFLGKKKKRLGKKAKIAKKHKKTQTRRVCYAC